MTRIRRPLFLSVMLVLAALACTFSTAIPTVTPNPNNSIIGQTVVLPVVELSVRAESSSPLNAPGILVQYKYDLKNTGSVPVLGVITFTGADVSCPSVNTVGNLDGNLDVNETITCTSSYAITQADLDKGTITSVVTATVNGNSLQPVSTTIPTVQNTILSLTKTASPTTFDHVGQTITYTYVITNNGNANVGPTQFTVFDSGFGAPIICGDANTTLAPTATLTCSANYVVTQADLDAASVSSGATASGGGAGTSQPGSATITKGGGTIQHTVADGEWLWQIARCYGTDPHKTEKANPQLSNLSQLSPGTVVNVPDVGSLGPVYGPPCVIPYTVQAGDTWSSIAQKYGTEVDILRKANPGGLTVGSVLHVPRNGVSVTGK